MRAMWMMLGLVAACGDNDNDAPPPVDADAPIELRMQVTIPVGVEAEYCQFVAIPDAWVTQDHVEFTAGSHHVLLYQTPYTAIPTNKDDGTPVDTSGVFDCSDGATNGWSITKLIGGSQNRNGAAALSFPPGVGIHVGGIALVNVHYINATEAPLETDVVIQLATIPEAEVSVEGDVLFLYNPLIAVPENAASRAHWQCPVHADITLSNAQSHMHARGVGFEARVGAAAPFYTSADWENVPVADFPAGHAISAGSTIDYACAYENHEARAVHQGPRTTDEMCTLVASYYPADPRTANCLDATGRRFGGTWVGSGTATCAATLACLHDAVPLDGIADCMRAADPAVATESSAVVRCFLNAGDPQTECGAEITACAAK